ncbi:MAG: hypothetical protein AAB426_09260, partial [Myxococcota bacterium]
LAVAVIRVLPFESGMDVQAIARRLGEALQGEAGFRALSEDLDALGSLPCVRRRYNVWVNRDSRLVKLIEERVVALEDRAYVVHVETLTESYGRFEQDFRLLFRSFRPTGDATRRTNRPQEIAALVGVWLLGGNEGSTLELRSDGSLVLAGRDGHFFVDGPSLFVSIGGGPE